MGEVSESADKPALSQQPKPSWVYCEDPVILRADADWHDRQAQGLAERANDLRERSDRHTDVARTMRDQAARLERDATDDCC